MKLSTMPKHIDRDVLERGRDYLLDGRVVSLEQTTDGFHRAVVQGVELYNVDIQIGDDGEILEAQCNCPYDYGPICKHEVAVLLWLSGESPRSQSGETGETEIRVEKSGFAYNSGIAHQSAVAPDTANGVHLRSLLEMQTKDALMDILLSLASDIPLAEQVIRLRVSRADMHGEVEECREYIRSYANEYADWHGFISYEDVSEAVHGAYHVLERAQQAFEGGEYVRSLQIAFCIFEEMLDLTQRADDSGGSIGMVINEALDRIESVSGAVKHANISDGDTVFQLLLQESEIHQLDGWQDLRLGLLQIAATLTTTPGRMHEWDEQVNRVAHRTAESAWSREYVEKRIVKMRYEMILEREGEGQAIDYVYEHLHIPGMRSLAIRWAIQHERYDEAIRLAKEGEEWARGAGYRGLVRDWKQLRFDAYGRNEDMQNQRSLGLELVLEGDYTYYPTVKKMYEAAEWERVYEALVGQFEERGTEWSVYAQILINERDTGRLLAYVSRDPSLVEQYYRHLIPEHLSEVIALFLTHIRQSAKRASNRGAYRDVCRIIRRLHKAGGKLEAREIVQELLVTYRRKPAFCDELQSM